MLSESYAILKKILEWAELLSMNENVTDCIKIKNTELTF